MAFMGTDGKIYASPVEWSKPSEIIKALRVALQTHTLIAIEALIGDATKAKIHELLLKLTEEQLADLDEQCPRAVDLMPTHFEKYGAFTKAD